MKGSVFIFYKDIKINNSLIEKFLFLLLFFGKSRSKRLDFKKNKESEQIFHKRISLYFNYYKN